MVRKSVQLGANARRTCPCFGMLCFLCAFIASLFGTNAASADTPLPVLKVAPVAAPATVLGMMNPFLIAAAVKKPKVFGFTFSQDLRDLVKRVETLAVHGVELNPRKFQQAEKLNLRVQSRLGGGVLQLCYRR